MAHGNEKLTEFMDRTCDYRAIKVVKRLEEGAVIRVCLVQVGLLSIIVDDYSENRASAIDVQVPWQAFEDFEDGTLKEIEAYTPFARVSEFEHYGVESGTAETREGWHYVCGAHVSDMTLFELAVAFALAADKSGQLRERVKAHRVKRALLPVAETQGEEPDPLL